MIRRNRHLLACLALALGCAASARAQDDETPRPPQLEALAACRSLADPTDKAACYDSALDVMLADVASGQLVAVDRAQIEQAERDSFGLPSFKVPGLGRLTTSDADETAASLRIVSFDRSPTGTIAFETDAGQRWVQVGSDFVRRLPDPPVDAVAEPAFGDTYFVSISGRPAVRMQRER